MTDAGMCTDIGVAKKKYDSAPVNTPAKSIWRSKKLELEYGL